MSQTPLIGDAELAARAARGSDQAFAMLYQAYVRPVYWLAYRLVGEATDAEDVTQETFLAAWRKLPELELVGDSLLPWLVTICRYQSANRVRRQIRDREHTAGTVDEQAPSPVDVERHVIDEEYVALILREVQGLSVIDQQVFRLCAIEGITYADAATKLGIQHGAVRNRLSRIRTHLRAVTEENA